MEILIFRRKFSLLGRKRSCPGPLVSNACTQPCEVVVLEEKGVGEKRAESEGWLLY